jgi:hypothetical protein
MELRGCNRVARRHFGSTAEGRARAALGDALPNGNLRRLRMIDNPYRTYEIGSEHAKSPRK